MAKNIFKQFAKKTLCQSGQIAVIVIVLIVVFMAAFAVILNIGKISQNAVMMTVAVDSSAALMSSLYASFAEAQYQSVLNTETDEDRHPLTRHGMPKWIATAVSVIIAIIGIVLAVVAGCFSAGAGGVAVAFGVIAIISAVLSTAALILQFAYVQPKTQEMWSKMFKDLQPYDRFREQGIQSLFGSISQDTVMVDDTGDFDMDGYYKGDGTSYGDKKISRFSILYTKRAEYLANKAKIDVVSVTDGMAIYAWKDEDKLTANPPQEGKWHVVRAQVAVPMRCNGQCGRTNCLKSNRGYGPYHDTDCPEPFMPWIKHWSHDVWFEDYWSLIDMEYNTDPEDKGSCSDNRINPRRGICGNDFEYSVLGIPYCRGLDTYKDAAACFKGGLVMAHVARYDEGGGDMRAGILSLWSMRFRNVAPGSPSPDAIEATCGPLMVLDNGMVKSVDGGASYGMPGAVVLNEPSPQNAACWTLLHGLLNQGVQARSCAEYFYRQGKEDYQHSRFAVKFVQCPNRPWPQ